MRHADYGIHRGTDFVRHVGKEVGFGFGGFKCQFLSLKEFVLGQLLSCDVLISTVHEQYFIRRFIAHQFAGGMNPDDIAVNRAFIGVDRVVMIILAINSALIALGSKRRRFRIGLLKT